MEDVLTEHDFGEILVSDTASPTAHERRHNKRFPFEVVQSMADYDGENLPQRADLRRVFCRNLSRSGISLLVPKEPKSKYAVVALGRAPRMLFLTVEIMNCKPATRGFCVGCRFLAKVSLPT